VPDVFPVPVLAGCLVSCPGCWCAVPRPDLRRHQVVCPGRLVVECGIQGNGQDQRSDEHPGQLHPGLRGLDPGLLDQDGVTVAG
jgi:hypothetical protein